MGVTERNQSFMHFILSFAARVFTVAIYVTHILAQSQGGRGMANDVIGTQEREAAHAYFGPIYEWRAWLMTS